MKFNAIECPADDDLQQLAAGNLPSADQDMLTTHLDQCPTCRDRLSALVGWDQQAQLAPAHLSVPGSQSPVACPLSPVPSTAPLLHLIDQLKSNPPTTHYDTGSTDGGDSPTPVDFLAPTDDPAQLGRLGRYLVQEEIGRGASGIVLKALDERLDRIVALKVLLPRLASNEHARSRFVREAKAAAAIRDDHVIGIHHVEEVAGLPFLVMEYIVGRSLGQRLAAAGPLPLPDILRIGAQIARGLAAAHAQGLVHRDIKPANILLENGVERVKITDFGLAHAVDDVRTTQPGVILGTPEYMSPEQARGQRVDHRSDLFSLGCVLYAMCAGRPPFRADSTMAVIRRVCDDTPRPLAEINPDVPAWLATFIDRLIEKAPDHRFQTATEVADLLEQCLAHLQECGAGVPPAIVAGTLRVPSRVPGVERSSTPAPRRHWAWAAAIIVLISVGLTLAESTGLTTLSATVIRIVRGDGTLVVEVDDPNIQILVDGEELVITGAGPKELRLRPGKHQLQTQQPGQPSETKLITVTKGGRDVVKVKREESVANSVEARIQLFSVAIDSQTGLPLSPRVIVNDGTSLIVERHAAAGLPLSKPLIVNDRNDPGSYRNLWGNYTRLLASPQGDLLARVSWNQATSLFDILVSRMDGSDLRAIPTGISAVAEICGWFPDGKSLMVWGENKPTSGRNAHYRVDLSARTVELLYDSPYIGPGRLSPDGKRHAFGMGGDLYVRNMTAGDEPRLLREQEGENSWNPDWSPDGKFIAFLASAGDYDFNRRLMVIPADGGEARELVKDVHNESGWPLWSPDGKFIAFYNQQPERGGDGIWLVRPDGGHPVFLDLGVEHVFNFFWSHDGKSLLFTGRDAVKVTRENSKVSQAGIVNRQVLADAPATFSVSPDGRLLAYTDEESGQLAVRELANGQQRLLTAEGTENEPASGPSVVAIWPPRGYKAWSPSFSSDGSLIAYWSRSKQPNKKELRVISVIGGIARTVFTPPHGGEEYLSGWTPDNRSVLANLYDESKTTLELTRISIADGSTTVIKSYPARNPSSFLSPDGKTVAFSRVTEPGSSERSLFLIDMATGRETLVPTPTARAWANAWTPDSKALLYETERLGTSELWMIRIIAGQPQGEPQLVRTDWSGEDLSITRDGTLYYGTWSGGSRAGPIGESHIYVAEIELNKGTAVASLLPAEKGSTTEDFALPEWSPDGDHLSYKVSGQGKNYEIRIVAIKGEQRRTLKPSFHSLNTLHWSPDGTTFLLTTSEQQMLRSALYSMNALTGNATTILEASDKTPERRAIYGAVWSADGTGAFYLKNQNEKAVALYDLKTGTDREILAGETIERFAGIRLSPDGRRLAAILVEKPNTAVLKLVDVDGTSTRDLLRIDRKHPPQSNAYVTMATWSPDSRHVIFLYRPTNEREQGLWFIPAEGGEPRELKLTGANASAIQYIGMHPTQMRMALITAEQRKYQIWTLENFLPPLTEAK